jgi:hypothetical protein
MQSILEALSQRALEQRLEADGGDWSRQMQEPPVQWLRWAMLRDASTLLSNLRIPAFVSFAQRMRAQTGKIPDVHLDAAQFYFLKLAIVVASHRLIRLPEYGPLWNGLQAQRLEMRRVIEALEKSGRSEEAQAWKQRMPAALRREDALKDRQVHPDAAVVKTPGTAHPGATVPATERTTGSVRP